MWHCCLGDHTSRDSAKYAFPTSDAKSVVWSKASIMKKPHCMHACTCTYFVSSVVCTSFIMQLWFNSAYNYFWRVFFFVLFLSKVCLLIFEIRLNYPVNIFFSVETQILPKYLHVPFVGIWKLMTYNDSVVLQLLPTILNVRMLNWATFMIMIPRFSPYLTLTCHLGCILLVKSTSVWHEN